MSMKILVTGGAGFIGSHLCARLLDDGHEVICLDNFHTGRNENVAHLLLNQRFSLVRHDVTAPLDADVDRIYNLACPASPRIYQSDPVYTVRVNVVGALNVLSLAQASGARVLQASTSEVYGDPAVHPQREDYWGHVNCTGPRACYDEGKRLAETLFFDYFRKHKVDIRVARIFNTYGPNMRPDDGRVVSNFIMQSLRHEPLTIYGDGRQTRSLCYVTDLVDGLVRLMESASTVGPINLGNPSEVTIWQLAELVLRLIATDSPMHVLPRPEDDPHQRRPDITRAKEMLDWSPRVDLRSGLAKTIPYFAALLRQHSILS